MDAFWKNVGEAIKSFTSRRVLVLQFDGVVLRASVLTIKKNTPYFLCSMQMQAHDIAETFNQLLAQLRVQCPKLPKRCVLITKQMVVAQIALPVNPEKPRKRKQMLELVRYDMEPIASQAAVQWSIGSLLVSLGYLSLAQRLDVLECIDGAISTLRFGEKAQSLGYLTDDQLAHALTIQKQIFGQFESLDCECSALSENGVDGTWPWLGAAIDHKVRDFWFSLCKQQHLNLEYIYPHTGASMLAIANMINADGVEIRPDNLLAWSCRQGKLNSFVEQMRGVQAISAKDVNALIPVDPQSLSGKESFYYHLDTAETTLESSLVEAWGVTARNIASSDIDADWVPTYGVAAHVLGLRTQYICTRIAGQDKVQIYQHPDFLRYALPVLALGAFVTGEVKLQLDFIEIKKRLAAIEVSYKEEDKQEAQIQAVLAEATALSKEVDALRIKNVAYANRSELLNDKVLGRLEILPNVLHALSAAVSDDVVLEEIREADKQGGFNVVAWGVSDAALLEFARNAQDELANIDFGVIKTEFKSAKGRTELPGYRISFWVVRDPDALLQSATDLIVSDAVVHSDDLSMPVATANKSTKKGVQP